MTPTSNIGLATCSNYQSCSTGCTRELILVTNKGRKNTNVRKIDAPQDFTNYLKDVMKVGKENQKVSSVNEQVFPPQT